jgi:hypothetical protein
MDATVPLSMHLPLDRVTVLAMDPGTVVGLSGLVTASVDGSSFDAATLFDFTAGGLRVVDVDPAHHAYVLAPSGQYAPACAGASGVTRQEHGYSGVSCLVPRLEILAHQRLKTASELASTLWGGIELESHPGPTAANAIGGAIAPVTLCLVASAAFAWLALALSRRAGRTALGRIRIAARQALRSTRGDATLEGARLQIRALVDRARQLDALRRACARRLARIDRAALDRRADACLRAAVAGHIPVAAEALASFSAERAAAVQLESDHGSAVVELERIESVLRTTALRVGGGREGQGARGMRRVHPRCGEVFADPVDALVGELDLRDEAIAEANAS